VRVNLSYKDLILFFFFFLGSTGVLTKGLMHARQVLLLLEPLRQSKTAYFKKRNPIDPVSLGLGCGKEGVNRQVAEPSQ
jgi:hypothetical protein